MVFMPGWALRIAEICCPISPVALGQLLLSACIGRAIVKTDKAQVPINRSAAETPSAGDTLSADAASATALALRRRPFAWQVQQSCLWAQTNVAGQR
jgi:hypothetical protein